MADYWFAHCDTCADSDSEGVRTSQRDVLFRACQLAKSAMMAKEAGWSICDFDDAFCQGTAQFIVRHAPCNAFRIRSEYGDSGRNQPLFPVVQDLPHPCLACGGRGLVPCPTCKPVKHQRRQADEKMRRAARQAMADGMSA